MNLEQLHTYLGELIEAGTPRTLPIVFPGQHEGHFPQEVSEATLISGIYDADPGPLAPGYFRRTEDCLLLSGSAFDLDTIKHSHDPQWPPVDAPVSPVRQRNV